MRLAVIADVFPPLRSSGAVQLRDLALELVCQGHEVTVLIASPGLAEPWQVESWRGVRLVRLKTPRNKDVSLARRAIAEFLMPFFMLRQLRHSQLHSESWEGIVWYSPTIFLGHVAHALKVSSGCRGYLIVRDIFPEWALDMEIMGKGPLYVLFRAVARYQYKVADIIGVQTPGNREFFESWSRMPGKRLEVLHNWLADAQDTGCSIDISTTNLAGRRILVYAGNLGVAQGAGVLLGLAERMVSRDDIGFVFVGRGSEVPGLRRRAADLRLANVLFFDEIDPDEIPGLYAQCHVGLVALDVRHRTHNIPGKFLSYMQAGLPVLAAVNPGNDIVELIRTRGVGRACTDLSVESLAQQAAAIVADVARGEDFQSRCRRLSREMFSAHVAARQIVLALQDGGWT